ncbi:MAG TPA: 2-dehydro-3-deoxy-6-phosphogalactonate aldolase [Beijerinckiaceae bacterium]|nr:2-dehydro-3-deoxy-6-phosphogalactonate aldolase [Beijerinckiaceae bacterium]
MPDHLTRFEAAFAAMPLIAILRGIRPEEAVGIGEALVAAGIRIIEVPLNSPEPFESITRLVRRFKAEAVIGAGTVRWPHEVERLRELGAGLVLSPHVDAAVVRASVAAGIVSIPGILTPTEAFLALNSGAHALKLFPMEMIGTPGARAMRAVLPRGTRLVAVGGVGEGNAAQLLDGACDGLGIGSSLYKPGDKASTVGERARRFIQATGSGSARTTSG